MTQIELRSPTSTDGRSVFKLIMECPPLDINSVYCNLLQCTHFSSTSVIATLEGEVVGFISGYLQPEHPETLFVWQVAVSEKARGQGLAKKMVTHILERKECAGVTHFETSITEDNQASWALFNSIARDFSAPLVRSLLFDKTKHFADRHDTEILARIGPLKHSSTNLKMA